MKVSKLKAKIDSVVMLTASNWKTELRSNRYHYASRWATLYPVIFVQGDLTENKYYFETTELENVVILHVVNYFSSAQPLRLIKDALKSKGLSHPLLWIYSPYLAKYIHYFYSPYRIYHATEDYFVSGFPSTLTADFLNLLTDMLNQVNEIICVSPGVKASFLNKNGKWEKKTHIITNGCDYDFYADYEISSDNYRRKNKIAFYQGNIFSKLDFELLEEVVKKLPGWTFKFCGPILKVFDDDWNKFAQNKNVEYLGILTPEELREQAYQSTVGIIPFKKCDYLIKSSLPLKAFEYLACGLPVVSTPIDALRRYDKFFLFASTTDEFIQQLLTAEKKGLDSGYINSLTNAASEQSYDKKFKELVLDLNRRIKKRTMLIARLKCMLIDIRRRLSNKVL